MLSGEPRSLPYPLDRAVVLENEVPDEAIPGQPIWPDDANERRFVLMELSQNEYVILASAIDAGRDPAYPDQSAYVWWLWNRVINAMEFCAKVIDCIENDEDTKAALSQWFANAVDFDVVVQGALSRAFDPEKGGVPIPPEYALKNQYGAALGCDPNDGWGHVRNGLIERSFQRVTDVLERIESVTNNQEMLAEFLNAIPGVGAFFDVIPVTDWVLWFDNVRAWMKEEFESNDTIDLRDQIACDLFCIWQQNCSLSLEQIRDYYWSKTVDLVPTWDGAFDSLSELAVALGQLSTVNFGEAVVYALVGSQYGFLTFINDWFGIHINSMANDLALGEPSDDWEILCDCPECGIGYTIDIGTETVPPDIVSAATALVSRLDIAGTAYGRRIELTFAVPVSSVTFGWNTEGALDDMFAKLGSNTTETLAAPSGSMTITGTASATFIVDLGYAGDAGAYASNPARISITDACT